MAEHILVVEDTVDLRTNIVELLEMEGYVVSFAQNGKEAWARLARITPSLIITDLMMPEMNGFDFITRVRAHTPYKTIPVLVYTAMPPQENEKRVLEMGANFYLKKPSSLDALLEAVKNVLHG
jgi:DNA-binding response OmpR family regulator